MATYTLTTTAPQEALLTWIVATHNKEKDLTQTNAEYVAARLPELLAPFVPRYADAVNTAVQTKFSAASANVQGQIATLLGGLP